MVKGEHETGSNNIEISNCNRGTEYLFAKKELAMIYNA